MRRNATALALALLLVMGCDTFADPDPAPVSVGITLEPGPAEPYEFLEGRLHRLFVTLVRGEGVSRDTVIEIEPEGNRIRARVRLDASDLAGDLRIDVQVRGDLFAMFEGSAVLSPRARSATIKVFPVALHLDLELDSVSFVALADSLRLPSGGARFGTGEVIPGARLSWSSRDPRVVEVTSAGTAIARGNGTTSLVASYGKLSHQVPVRVRQVLTGPTRILPTDTTVGIADIVHFRLDARDRNGFPITVESQHNWIAEPFETMEVSPEGFAYAKCLGNATVSVEGVSARARVAVVARSSAIAELVWTTGPSLSAGDLSGRARADAVQGPGEQPTRRPGTEQIAYVRDGLLYTADLFSGRASRNLPIGSDLRASWPEYSADGAWIYFGGQGPSGSRIYRIRPDGSGLEAMTPVGVSASMPTTSPDGTQLAYVRGADLVAQELRGQPRVVAAGVGPRTPRWSPDGRWIAYLAGAAYPSIVRQDGSERWQLSGYIFYPGITWSPDGTRLLGAEGGAILIADFTAFTWSLCWHPLGEVDYSSDVANTFGFAWWR